MDDLVIRPIDITKRIEVAKLYKAIRMAEDASRVPHTRKDRILRKLREDVDRAYMFQRGSRLIGAARISSDPSYRYIKDFAIFKPHQGKGNGTAAFSKLLEVVPGEGPIELDVGIDNDRAQKLYENAGFEKMHQWKSTGNWHMKKASVELREVNDPTYREWKKLQRATNLASKASGSDGAWTLQEVKDKAKKKNFEKFLISQGKRDIGAVQVNPADNWITNFGIFPRYQNKGYGRESLMLLVAALQKKRPGMTVRIGAYQGNQRAKHLYESSGFEPEYEDEKYIDYKKEASSERSIKTPEDLENLYKGFKYRILNQKTGRPYFNTNKETFDNWQRLTVAQMLKHKIGICYDTAALNKYFLEKWGIPHDNLFAYTKRSITDSIDDDPTHTFTIYKDKDKWKWLEGAWEPYKNNGWSYENKDELIKVIGQHLANAAQQDTNIGRLTEYPESGTSMDDFYRQALAQAVKNPVIEASYNKAASMLYHASPKALDLLDGMTTRHGATGSVFVSPSKYHASLFALDRQGLINELENKIGKKHIKVNNLSYGQWKDLPSDKKLDHADVYIDTDEEFEPFSGEQKGYLYSMDAEPYKDKIKKWKHDNGDRELLVEGNITPDKQEEISIKYDVHPGRAPWLENYHRVTYGDTGVYQALKEALPPEEWKAFLQEASWLPKPTVNYTDAYKSYFTDAGYKKFLENTMPYIEKHLDKSKLETEHTGIDKTPVYSDNYQAVIAD